MKEKINKLDFIKIKKLLLYKFLLKESKDKPWTGKKYFQNMYLIEDLYPKYTKNP